MTLHILSLATLFPDASRPNFGIFVEKSLNALARQPDVALTIVAPIGLPPWPLSLHPRYAALRALPLREQWRGLTLERPRFTLIPRFSARFNAMMIARAVWPIAQRMRTEQRLDVVDAQFFHPDGPAAAHIAARLGLPFSIKARGSDISFWANRADTGGAIRRAAQSAAGLLAVSVSLKADMVALGMPEDRIHIHYTGLDAEQFHPVDSGAARARWGQPLDAPVLLTVGALTHRKGQHIVLQAMARLPADTHYVLAGGGEEAGRLAKLAEVLGLAGRVHLLGAVAHDSLASLYSAADVMVLPSASEGLANAWVEALACGTPLVLSDIPPAHEMIDAADAGRIAAATPQGIADAVRAVLRQRTDREALAARTKARFDWQRNGAELAEHLRGLAMVSAANEQA